MNNVNKMAAKPAGMVQVPEVMLAQMYSDIHELVKMHRKLIALYEEESQLKKSHKAYLHVRDHADEVCRMDKKRVAEIREHYSERPDRKEKQEMTDGIWGVIILPAPDDAADECSHCDMKCGEEQEQMKAVDDFFNMLMGVLVEKLAEKEAE